MTDEKKRYTPGLLEPILSGAVVLVALIIFIVSYVNLTGQRDQARGELAEYKAALKNYIANSAKENALDDELLAMLAAHYQAVADGDEAEFDKTLKNPADERLREMFDATSYTEYVVNNVIPASDSSVLDDGSEEMMVGLMLSLANAPDRMTLKFAGVVKDGGRWVVTRYL